MPEHALRTMRVEGFTSIVNASVYFGPINVLVGANGAGKSNLVRALELLGRIVDEDLRLHVRRNGGASGLLNSATTERRARLEMEWVAVNNGGAGYVADLAPGPDDDLFFTDEQIAFRSPSEQHLHTRTLDRGHRETRLYGPAAEFDVVAEVVVLLRGCRVFHFHDTSADAPVNQPTSTADNLALRPDAANLAAMLSVLRNSDDPTQAAVYRRIVGAIQLVAPFFRDFVLESEGADSIRLRWRDVDGDAVFSGYQMSDGTLRFVCLATLLLQPDLPALVVLDEPELGLHPYAIVVLAGLIRQASTRSQVILATQSVTLMNQFELGDLIVVERGDSGSTFSRPDPESLHEWLQDYSLGELWEKNLLRGRPGIVHGG